MRTLILAIVAICVVGCSSVPHFAADHWVHEGRYGPVTTHYEAFKITRVGDEFVVDRYHGSITVLGGYGMSDTIEGLRIPVTSKTTP